MKYKVGDKVLLYTWDEMIEKFGLWKGNINIRDTYWTKNEDSCLPQNRIITIKEINIAGYYNFNSRYCVYQDMIKSHANEYYLQQIKEEMCK